MNSFSIHFTRRLCPGETGRRYDVRWAKNGAGRQNAGQQISAGKVQSRRRRRKGRQQNHRHGQGQMDENSDGLRLIYQDYDGQEF